MTSTGGIRDPIKANAAFERAWALVLLSAWKALTLNCKSEIYKVTS